MEQAGYSKITLMNAKRVLSKYMNMGFKWSETDINRFMALQIVTRKTRQQYYSTLTKYLLYRRTGRVPAKRGVKEPMLPELRKLKAKTEYWDHIWGKPAVYMDSHSAMWR